MVKDSVSNALGIVFTSQFIAFLIVYAIYIVANLTNTKIIEIESVSFMGVSMTVFVPSLFILFGVLFVVFFITFCWWNRYRLRILKVWNEELFVLWASADIAICRDHIHPDTAFNQSTRYSDCLGYLNCNYPDTYNLWMKSINRVKKRDAKMQSLYNRAEREIMQRVDKKYPDYKEGLGNDQKELRKDTFLKMYFECMHDPGKRVHEEIQSGRDLSNKSIVSQSNRFKYGDLFLLSAPWGVSIDDVRKDCIELCTTKLAEEYEEQADERDSIYADFEKIGQDIQAISDKIKDGRARLKLHWIP